MRERQMGMYRGPGAAPHGEAAGLKGPGQASVLPLQGVLCPQGEPVNTYVPVLTSIGPACAAPDRWPLSVPPLPISLKETLNQLGVKSEEAGVGAVALGKILSPKPAPNLGRTFLFGSSAEKLRRKLRRLPCLQAPRAPRGAGITEPPGIIKKSKFLFVTHQPFPEHLQRPHCPCSPYLQGSW